MDDCHKSNSCTVVLTQGSLLAQYNSRSLDSDSVGLLRGLRRSAPRFARAIRHPGGEPLLLPEEFSLGRFAERETCMPRPSTRLGTLLQRLRLVSTYRSSPASRPLQRVAESLVPKRDFDGSHGASRRQMKMIEIE